MTLSDDDMMLSLYLACLRIRMIEEEIANRYGEQKMRCPTHLSVGQELAGAAIGLAVEASDHAFSTHRSHAHYLGKGGSLEKMIAELYGKSTGCCRGMGGSMHLRDADVGFIASTAIVGNSIPLAVGDALVNKLEQNDNITIVFIGDSVFETGVLYESLNIAATFKLPILFVCENNLYSVYSPLKVRQPVGRENYKIVEKMDISSWKLDGTNAVEVFYGLKKAVEQCRKNRVPVFVEMSAYRWREHCGPEYDNHIGYRTENEFQHWKQKDYLLALERNLTRSKTDINDYITEKKKQYQIEIMKAFEFAEQSHYPDISKTGYLEFWEDEI